MIVRVFRVRTHPGMEADFRRFMLEKGRPGLLQRPGCISVTLGQSQWGERPESLIVSRWESLEALKQLAGDHFQEGHINPAAAHLIEQVFCHNYVEVD